MSDLYRCPICGDLSRHSDGRCVNPYCPDTGFGRPEPALRNFKRGETYNIETGVGSAEWSEIAAYDGYEGAR